MINDLGDFNKKTPIDLIVISGDLIDKGGYGFDSIGDAFSSFSDEFLEPLKNRLNLSTNQIYFCPGNHDIDRNKDSNMLEHGLACSLIDTTKVNNHVNADCPEGIERIKDYKVFEKMIHEKHTCCDITDFHSSYIYNSGKNNVGLACFNSAWRAYDDNDFEKLIIGEKQLLDARTAIKDTDFRVAVMHHPIDWLHEFDRDFVESVIFRDFHILLCGHIHKSSTWVRSTIHQGVVVSVGPANWTTGIRSNHLSHTNGYSIIDIDSLEVNISHRRYCYLKEKYIPNNELGDDHGISSFALPTESLREENRFKQAIICNIDTIHQEEFNEHLLTYHTDTKAPKILDDIFVLPQIIEKIEGDSTKNSDEKVFDISQICNNNNNLIILGDKESGKTVLLDRLTMEYIKGEEVYNTIPVYMNFNEMRSQKISTIIARYLNISPKQVAALCCDLSQ